MSFSINKFNRGTQFDYKLPQDAKFIKLAELHPGEQYRIHGLLISKKSLYGDHPVAIGDIFYIDLPKNMLDEVNEILSDQDAVDAIRKGLVGIVPEEYHSQKYNKDCMGAKWIDMTPED